MGPLRRWRGKAKQLRDQRRAKCVVEHALGDAVDSHWADADVLMRQTDAMDSIMELERVRRSTLDAFRQEVLAPLKAQIPREEDGSLSAEAARRLHAEKQTLFKPVEEFDDIGCLRRLYYAVAVMEMYKRHNSALRKEALRRHRENARTNCALRERVRELELKVHRAQRESWCVAQTRLWDPVRFSSFEKKPLASEGGPPSVQAGLEGAGAMADVGGLARLVQTLEHEPVDHAIQQGKSYSDAVSKIF